MALDFYHGHGSPYSWRVWLALEHLGVPYELKVLSFSEKDHLKPAFVAINPRHRVPTIVDEGFVVWESLAILEYLDERFGKGKARLYPGTVQDRARIRRLIREDEEDLDGKASRRSTRSSTRRSPRAPPRTRAAWTRLAESSSPNSITSAASFAATFSRATRRRQPISSSIRTSPT